MRVHLNFNSHADIIFWSICIVAFFGLLRKSNLLPPSPRCFNSHKHFVRDDLTLTSDGFLLQMRWSKTIQFRQRTVSLPLPFLPGHPLCPATAVTRLLALHPHLPKSAPLFSYVTVNGLIVCSQAPFLQRMNRLLALLNLDPKLFSGHSFRRGGATWAFKAGLPGELVQMLGDWASDSYKRYIDVLPTSKFSLFQQFTTNLPS